jgi:K+-transporting ATPase ATPase C chain
MFVEVIKQIKIAFILVVILTVLTGLIYPVLVTSLAQTLFPWKANGSFLQKDGKRVGSLLIGQAFTDPKYFWSRPSATLPYPYNATNSSGSNNSPTNSSFLAIVKDRVTRLHQADPENHELIPIDLVTASGSGLDPDISPAAALYQVHRIAVARRMTEQELQKLIHNLTKSRLLLILGEPRVNVLQLNKALDNLELNIK